MENEIKEIFEDITEYFDVPLRLSSRCETKVYYHVEDLTSEDLQVCAAYIAERIEKVCHPPLPEFIINLPGSYTGLASILSAELSPPGEEIEVIRYDKMEAGNGFGKRLRNARVLLVNDVITTARSCLKAHTKTTMMGASVLCWAALIDRTFGPGPVPVVSAFTGAPVTLLEELP